MSFSWWCEDKDGRDLFEEFDVNRQALGLGPNGPGTTEAPHSVGDIRHAWNSVPYKEKLEDAARDAVAIVQRLARENKESLIIPPHCPTCTCEGVGKYRATESWDIANIDKLLAVPLDRVWRAGGGY